MTLQKLYLYSKMHYKGLDYRKKLLSITWKRVGFLDMILKLKKTEIGSKQIKKGCIGE